jgi:hypothetical protein
MPSHKLDSSSGSHRPSDLPSEVFASVQRQGDETRPDDKPVLPFWPQTDGVAHMRSKRSMRKMAMYLLSLRFFSFCLNKSIDLFLSSEE